MAAITWRNVSGPTGAAELNAIAGASRQIGGAFDGLQNSLVNYQKEEGRHFEQRKTDNTNAFLNALHSQYRTPEELDAAMKSGAINQLQQQYSGEIHSDQTRGAAEQRLTTLRQNTTAANQYEDQLRDRADSELVQKAMAHLAGGGKATDVLPSLQGTRKYGDYAKMLQDAERGNIRFEWDGQNQTWGIRQKQANINQSNAAANASRVSAANSQAANARAEREHGLRMGLLETEVNDKQDTALGTRLAAEYNMAHSAEQAKAHQQFTAIAKAKGIPVEDGRVNFMLLTPEQQKILTDEGSKVGLNTATVFAGDTAAQQALVDRITARNDLSPMAKQAALKAVKLDSTGVAEVGNDAAATALRKAADEAEMKAFKGLRPAPSTDADMQPYVDAAREALKGKKDTGWFSTDNFEPGVYDALLKEGIVLKDGTRYLPSPAEFGAMIGSLDSSMFRSDSQEVRKVIQDWAKKKSNISNATKANEYFSRTITRELEKAGKK